MAWMAAISNQHVSYVVGLYMGKVLGDCGIVLVNIVSSGPKKVVPSAHLSNE